MEKINISALLSNKHKNSIEPIKIYGNVAIEDFEDFSFPDSYNYNITIWPSEDKTLILSGSMDYKWYSTCNLCLDDIAEYEEVRLSENIYPNNINPYELLAKSEELESDLEDSEFLFHDGRYLDLNKYLEDTVILNLPLIAKCSDDCPGLCALCGNKNLDNHKCIEKSNEEVSAVRSEFDKLKDLL